MTKDEILNKLIDEILTMPKFKNFEGEKKIVLRNKLIKEYNERINKAIVINMPIEKSEEFLNVLDSKNIEKIDQFIQVNIPNIDDILEAETSMFVQQLLLKGQEE